MHGLKVKYTEQRTHSPAFFIVKMAYYPHLNKKDLFSCEHSTQSKSSMYACIMLGTEFGTFTVFYSKYVLMSLPDL